MNNPRRLDLRRAGRVAGKLIAVGPRGWSLLLQAGRELTRARRLVAAHPQGELIDHLRARYTEATGEAGTMTRAEDAARAIERAARFGHGRPLCLVRSIALHQLLERRGIHGSRVRIGVRMAGSGFQAHAWVELAGSVIGDDPAFVEGFSPLPEVADPLPPFSFSATAVAG